MNWSLLHACLQEMPQNDGLMFLPAVSALCLIATQQAVWAFYMSAVRALSLLSPSPVRQALLSC